MPKERKTGKAETLSSLVKQGYLTECQSTKLLTPRAFSNQRTILVSHSSLPPPHLNCKKRVAALPWVARRDVCWHVSRQTFLALMASFDDGE